MPHGQVSRNQLVDMAILFELREVGQASCLRRAISLNYVHE